MSDGRGTSFARGGPPRAPLGHLTRLGLALLSAPDIDEIARALLTDLRELPGVRRVGLALTEGGGRRLRFVHTDRALVGQLEWCHIDAYDDVPLTEVVRTGKPVFGGLGSFGARFEALLERERGRSRALAAVPLPGVGSPIGGLLLYFDEEQAFAQPQVRLLEAAAARTAEAIRRVRLTRGRDGWDPAPEEPTDPGAPTARVVLEGSPLASSTARHFLREKLAEWAVDDDTTDNAVLCLSELVTNAVIHAGTPSELRASLQDGVLTVMVRDLGGLGRTSPLDAETGGEPDPLRVYGRGLMLVDALSDRWGSERDVTGTTVWFALELGEPSGQPAQTG